MMERNEEALPVLEANLDLCRRYWSHDETNVFAAQSNLASCLAALGRCDRALVLMRETYARCVAIHGVSDESAIRAGANVAVALIQLEIWDESRTLLRDQLLPAARRLLGNDDDLTLGIKQALADILLFDPERTREDLCFEL